MVFVFLFSILVGFICIPFQSILLPWFIWLIALPFMAIAYLISEIIFNQAIENLKQFFKSEFLALIIFFMILLIGVLVGGKIFELLATMIKSLDH